MRLLLDETLGRSVMAVLRKGGHDVVRSSQAGGPGLSDEELVATACSEDRVLVTLDDGFADAARFDPGATPGIVVVSLPDEHPAHATWAVDEMLSAVQQARRAALDLATERRRLEDDIERLRLSARADVEQRIETLTKRRDVVAAQERETAASAEDLANRVQAARTAFEVDAAQTLIDSAGVFDDEEPPTPDDDGQRAVAAPADGDPDAEASRARAEARAAARAVAKRAAVQLAPVWGPLADELARALSQLLLALDTSDPRGQLWIASLDGIGTR